MTKTPEVPPFVSIARSWFVEHNCRALRVDQSKNPGEQQGTVYEYWLVRGRTVILAYRSDWCDVFIPITDSNSTAGTLAALDALDN